MKARLKATGEIVEVNEFCTLRDSGERTYYWVNALELITQDSPDYWTRLEHTYAGMAMQGLVTRGEVLGATKQEIAIEIADISDIIAHALVEKLKEKEERECLG
jgi:hypothetical protein